MSDTAAGGDALAVLDALYRAAETTPGVELLLNCIPVIEGGHATVSSVSVVLGGDLREPGIRRCQHLTDTLHRDSAGRWHVDPRADDGADVSDMVDIDASTRAGVLALMTRYGRCADRDPAAPGWQDCFVDDAVLSSYSPRPGRPPAVLTGCAAIERAFAAAGPTTPTTHVTSNVVIEPSGTVVTVEIRSAFVRFDHFPGAGTVVGSFGRYRDRARRCADGLWRFSEREIHLISRRPPKQA